MSNWQNARLGDLCDILSSKRIFAKEYVSEGVPFFRGKEIIEKQKGNDISTELFISRERYEELKTKSGIPSKGDILLTSVGTLGVPWVVDDNEFYFKDGNLTWFRNFKDIDSKFLYYWILSSKGKEQIEQKCIGSTQRALTIDTLRKFEINLPSLEEQRRIAGILGALDDKIEVNSRINRNLEQQAEALFRRWFVDFEFPNPDGKPYLSAGGTLTPSPQGNIPLGWEVGTLGDLVISTLGGDWGKESAEGNFSAEVYCIRGADIPEVSKGNMGKMPIRYILPKNHASKKLSSGDIVVEISGGSPTQSTGRVALIGDEFLSRFDKDMVCTNFCRAVKPKDGFSVYTYYLWRHLYSQNVMFSYENGTTGIKNLDLSGLLDTEQIIIPNEATVIKFTELINSFSKTIYRNAKQNQTLAQMRDALLPKLMNNEM